MLKYENCKMIQSSWVIFRNDNKSIEFLEKLMIFYNSINILDILPFQDQSAIGFLGYSNNQVKRYF